MANYYKIISGSNLNELDSQATELIDEGWAIYGKTRINGGTYYQTLTNNISPNYYELNRENLSKYYIANNIATGSWPTTSVYPQPTSEEENTGSVPSVNITIQSYFYGENYSSSLDQSIYPISGNTIVEDADSITGIYSASDASINNKTSIGVLGRGSGWILPESIPSDDGILITTVYKNTRVTSGGTTYTQLINFTDIADGKSNLAILSAPNVSGNNKMQFFWTLANGTNTSSLSSMPPNSCTTYQIRCLVINGSDVKWYEAGGSSLLNVNNFNLYTSPYISTNNTENLLGFAESTTNNIIIPHVGIYTAPEITPAMVNERAAELSAYYGLSWSDISF